MIVRIGGAAIRQTNVKRDEAMSPTKRTALRVIAAHKDLLPQRVNRVQQVAGTVERQPVRKSQIVVDHRDVATLAQLQQLLTLTGPCGANDETPERIRFAVVEPPRMPADKLPSRMQHTGVVAVVQVVRAGDQQFPGRADRNRAGRIRHLKLLDRHQLFAIKPTRIHRASHDVDPPHALPCRVPRWPFSQIMAALGRNVRGTDLRNVFVCPHARAFDSAPSRTCTMC